MAENDDIGISPIRLLLVDDEEDFVNVLAKRIGKRKIQVRKSCSGFNAIQILRQERFDVAVLDLKMEDMDGIEVLKIFRKIAPNLQVIMLTGHGSEIAAREGMKYGAVDYLIKPCDFDVLVDKIQQAVSRRR
ncbi:MAG: response regulator [Deltaproteobacteria bacterium]|nr:response regulator [Deltaproteobacteria bacterium]